MTDGPDVVPADEDVLADDPFWRVFRRRHPDVDVVILPGVPEQQRAPAQESAPGPQGDTVTVDPDSFAHLEHEGVREAWAALVAETDGFEAVHPVVTGRWTPGTSPDRVRREVTAVVEDPALLTDPVAAGSLLRAAARYLEVRGWRVLVPSEGLPRVLASGQDPRGGTRDVQLVHASAQGRLVLRSRSPELLVGDAALALVSA